MLVSSIMDEKKYDLCTQVVMKKGNHCGGNLWEVVRMGADIKIKCLNCGRVVMIPRIEFNKKIKKIVLTSGDLNE